MRLINKSCSFPIRFIIYDSSPAPIGIQPLGGLLPNNNFIYREIFNNLKGNTYYPVLQEFCLSSDSANGAFIVPHDEVLLIDYSRFTTQDLSKLFTCGSQFSFDPSSFNVAEYTNCLHSGEFTAEESKSDRLIPQMHATFFPPFLLHQYGHLIKNFISRYSLINAAFLDFALLKLLKILPIFYSTNSIYLQERLIKRKTSGQFLHPSQFIQYMSANDQSFLVTLIREFFDSFLQLSSSSKEYAVRSLFDLDDLRSSLMLSGINRYTNLFHFDAHATTPQINFKRLDTFICYHSISRYLTKDHIEKIFYNKTMLHFGSTLDCLWSILQSY